jgi:flagellar hook-associated protein 2
MSSTISYSNLSTSSSGTSSFAGIASGINTTALIQAEISQASLPMQQLQAKQTANTSRSSALSTLESNMQALSSALGTMNGAGFSARTVNSSDSTNSYVTATASGGASGSFQVQVQNLATYAQLSPSLDSSGNPTNLAVASATAPVFDTTKSSTATFTIEDTNGVTRQITLAAGQNNIYALADAINAAGSTNTSTGAVGLGVTATVVNTGSGSDPYELILKSASTGIGTAGANFTIADTTTVNGQSVAANTLGIASGTLSTDGSTLASGGTQSNQAAQNAQFTLDGIQITRASNTVSDAVNGVTFNLIQGGQAGTTNLTVAPDTSTALTDMQGVVSAYNTLMTTYNTDTASGGALAGDLTSQALIGQIQAALTGLPAGIDSSTAAYNSASSLGLSTNPDGTLSLDTTAFTTAFEANPNAAQNVFASSGNSTNDVVSLSATGVNAISGTVGFNITSFTSGGAVSGTFTAPDGSQYTLSGTNGLLAGAAGTPLAGLYFNVTGTGTGSISLVKGVGQAVEDDVADMTNPATGTITTLLTQITNENSDLATQITAQQSMLNAKQAALESQYSQMEATLSQLQASEQSIGSIT